MESQVPSSALPEVLQATPATLDALVFAPKGLLVVLYLWGKDCPNCEIFARYLPRLLNALRDKPVRMVKCNVYEHPEVATRFAVVGIPAFFLVRDGKRLGKMSEFHSYDGWLGVVEQHLPEG